MSLVNLFKVSQHERNKFCTKIIDASAPSEDYYFLIALSTLLVALGLLAENLILIIGGMLVTPLLSPILAVALGMVINVPKVIIRSIRILLTSILFAFVVSLFTGLFSAIDIDQLELIAIMKPSLFTMIVAIVAGIVASFAWVKPGHNDTLPGIAVTVTIIPPLAAIGLTISHGEWALLRNVVSVFVLNLFGIVVASLVVFSLMEFYKAKRKVVEEVKEEEKILKQKEKKNNDDKEKKQIIKEIIK